MQNELIKKAAKPKLVLFDIYETLLSMDLIERRINQMLDSKRGYIIWFELFIQYCLVDNSTGRFHDFSSIAKAFNVHFYNKEFYCKTSNLFGRIATVFK